MLAINLGLSITGRGSAAGVPRALIFVPAGQSNDVPRSPNVTASYPAKLQTFVGAAANGDQSDYVSIDRALRPAHFATLADFNENGSDRESLPPGLSAADSYYSAIVAFTAAVGGFHWRQLNSGAGAYANVAQVLDNGRRILLSSGYAADQIDAVLSWAMGEGDADTIPPGGGSETAVTRTEWAGVCARAVTEYTAVWRYISHDPTASLTMLAGQLVATPTDGQRDVQSGMLDAALSLGGSGFHLAGPRYGVEHEGDGVHMTGLGFRLWGEYLALRLAQIRAGVTLPPYVTSASVAGTDVTLNFNRAVEIDTTTLADTTAAYSDSKYGLEVFDSGTPVLVTGGSMVTGTQFVGTLASSVTGTATARLGQMTWPGGTAAVSGALSKLCRTNFREPASLGSTVIGAVTYEHYSWACNQELSV